MATSPDARPLPWRTAALVLLPLVFIIASALAILQAPRPDALRQAEGWQTLVYPYERHSERRLIRINGHLNAITGNGESGRVWAVGNDGLIVTTRDGGAHWQQQSWPGGPALAQVSIPDRRLALNLSLVPMAVAADNPPVEQALSQTLSKRVISTQEQQVQQSQYQQVKYPEPEVKGGVSPSSPTVYESLQIEADTATQAPELPRPHLYAIEFVDGRHGWIVGQGGTILVTTDGGQSWTRQPSPVAFDLTRVSFVSPRVGWALAPGNSVLKTEDGGQSWRLLPGSISTLFNDLQFFDIQTGVATNGLGIYLTRDGGSSWSDISPAGKSAFNGLALYFLNGSQGWMAGVEGSLMRTTDGGQTWNRLNTGVTDNLTQVFFADADHGWALTGGGVLLGTVDGGNSWNLGRPSALTPDQRLNQLYFSDAEQGWVVGTSGTLLASIDGGRSWFAQSRRPAVPDTEGAYQRWPAPWYLLLVLVLIPVTWVVARSKSPVVVQEEHIADMLASDRPLQPGDPDPLHFGEIARGLSRFMRNPATEPPLTVAITGEWGTGKSSLMNLLRHDLQTHGFTPVWFNAWHHQKGEQLLASLYATIRQQAVPGWLQFHGLRPVGLLFRLKLLFIRSLRQRLLFIGATVLLVAAISYLLSHPQEASFQGMASWLENSAHNDIWDALMVVLVGVFPPLAAFLRAFQAFGLTPSRLLTRNGESTGGSKLDPGARQRFAADFSDVTSCLQMGRMVIFIDDLDRCSKENVLEIMEVINFLSVSGDCYIVVGMAEEWVKTCIGLGFEDLAKHIYGKPQSKTHAVTTDEKALPSPFDVREQAPGFGDNGNADLRQFAEQYLEKLINIQVPLPTLSTSDADLLLAPRGTAPESGRLLQRFWRGLRALYEAHRTFVWAGMLALFAIYLGLHIPADLLRPATESAPQVLSRWSNVRVEQLQTDKPLALQVMLGGSDTGGQRWDLELQAHTEIADKLRQDGLLLATLGAPEGQAQLRLRLGTDTSNRTTGETEVLPSASSVVGTALPALDGPVGIYPGAEGSRWPVLTLVTLLTVVLLTVLVWAFNRRPAYQVKDSAAFVLARQIWRPWITARRLTPRHIKRYLNKVRYMAMRYGSGTVSGWQPSTWPPALARHLESRQEDSQPREGLDEASLVALSAIAEFDASWVNDDARFSRLSSAAGLLSLLQQKYPGQFLERGLDASEQRIFDLLRDSIDKHRQTFGDRLFEDVDQRQRYQSYSNKTLFK